jgi:sporadic carbohydrate cluster 2OG-Fe(II) oxygenase
MTSTSFLTADDRDLTKRFLNDGYIIRKCESMDSLNQLRASIIEQANEWLAEHHCESGITSLSDSHQVTPEAAVNDMRLRLFARLNADPKTRLFYFHLASNLIQSLVGNELAMQNKVNISIQQPLDQSSVLELHSDVWAGDCPFQVVLWVPLTDASETNAMFLLSPSESRVAYQRSREGDLGSMAEIHEAYRTKLRQIELQYGEVLVFDSNCLHGNQLNTTKTTRWSLNCRLVSLLAPSTTPERRLGSFYSPVMVRPATLMGLRAVEALGLTD